MPTRRAVLLGAAAAGLLSACGTDETDTSNEAATTTTNPGPLNLSAIPDQDPEKLNRLYPAVASRVSEATGAEVTYTPLTDYTSVVRAFEVGDIHLAWMGGLTGVQARSRVKGAKAIAQRDIDAAFHSLFIATKASGLMPFTEVSGLTDLAGHTLTFGSETSTSGRLMPQYFMAEAGFDESTLKGTPGFSGSHDATIEAVVSGSFEVGAVNEQVWKATVEKGEVNLDGVQVLWRTPGYADYHWLARPDIDSSFGAGTLANITKMLLELSPDNPADAEVLDLFGAKAFVTTANKNYDKIEEIAREQGLLG